MFRFTIRDVLWLMVVVGLGIELLVEVKGRRKYQLTISRWASVEEQEWAKERFTAAKAEFEQTKGQNSFGRGLDLESTQGAIERFARAAEELPADPQTRVKE